MVIGYVALQELAWWHCVRVRTDPSLDARQKHREGVGLLRIDEILETKTYSQPEVISAKLPCVGEPDIWVICNGCGASLVSCSLYNSCCRTCKRAEDRVGKAPRPVQPVKCKNCHQFSVEGSQTTADEPHEWYCLKCWRKWERSQDCEAEMRMARTADNVRQYKFLLEVAVDIMKSWSVHPQSQVSCMRCGTAVNVILSQTAKGTPGMCPSCWLCREGDNQFLSCAQTVGAWPSLEELFMMLSGPQESHKLHIYPSSEPRREPSNEGTVIVVWDACDAICACMTHAIWTDFHTICSFVEWHREESLAALLASHPTLPSDVFSVQCCVTAILPSGIFIANCQRHPRILLYELQYLIRVHTPLIETQKALQYEFESLLKIRSAPEVAGFARWWLSPRVLELVLSSLDKNCFAVIDEFLEPSEMRCLRADAQQLYLNGYMTRGNADQSYSYWGDDMADEFANGQNVRMKWSAFGNHKLFVGDHSTMAPGVRCLPRMTDMLLSHLKNFNPDTSADVSHTVKRLQAADLREHVMVATYRGGEQGRYLRHTDIGRNAVLTMLYYLNHDWTEEDAGHLRVYHPGHTTTRVRYDVLPVGNRLLMFWANEDCPHEVLPTRRDRYAMTVWYRSAADVLHDKAGVDNLLKNLHPVAPLTVEDVLLREGADPLEARRIETMYRACVM